MITGRFIDLQLYRGTIPCIAEIADFITKDNLPNVGEWLVLSEYLKVIRLTDFNRANELYEAHAKYYDFHFTLKGIDDIKICMSSQIDEAVTAYDQEKDYTLYKGRPDVKVALNAQTWAFILPHEPHRNEFREIGTEKLVFKILING
jgi:YhcH/YjgK/YiaL family protein